MITIRFIPYSQIENMSSEDRIDTILDMVKDESVVLLEGRLRKNEETELIKKTMEMISETFKGIEISVMNPEQKNKNIIGSMRSSFVNLILGDRSGLTFIGPASIIQEIKKDPEKVLLCQENEKKRKRK